MSCEKSEQEFCEHLEMKGSKGKCFYGPTNRTIDSNLLLDEEQRKDNCLGAFCYLGCSELFMHWWRIPSLWQLQTVWNDIAAVISSK